MSKAKQKLSEQGDRSICAFALIIKENKILSGLRKYDVATVWVLPGGRSEEDEKIKKTLIREVEEETGITDLEIKEFFGSFEGASDGDIVYVFICETNEDPVLKEPEKFEKWEYKNVEEFNDDFLNDDILESIKEYL